MSSVAEAEVRTAEFPTTGVPPSNQPARKARSYVPIAEAARLADVAPSYIRKLATKGLIPSRLLPGKALQIERRGVERLARESARWLETEPQAVS